MEESYEIGDTVRLIFGRTALRRGARGIICYKYSFPDKTFGSYIFELDSTGSITYDGSSFVGFRLVLTEKAPKKPFFSG